MLCLSAQEWATRQSIAGGEMPRMWINSYSLASPPVTTIITLQFPNLALGSSDALNSLTQDLCAYKSTWQCICRKPISSVPPPASSGSQHHLYFIIISVCGISLLLPSTRLHSFVVLDIICARHRAQPSMHFLLRQEPQLLWCPTFLKNSSMFQ